MNVSPLAESDIGLGLTPCQDASRTGAMSFLVISRLEVVMVENILARKGKDFIRR